MFRRRHTHTRSLEFDTHESPGRAAIGRPPAGVIAVRAFPLAPSASLLKLHSGHWLVPADSSLADPLANPQADVTSISVP